MARRLCDAVATRIASDLERHAHGADTRVGPHDRPACILANISTGILKTHPDKRAVTYEIVYRQVRNIQRDIGLHPYGNHGPWTRKAEERMVKWLLKPSDSTPNTRDARLQRFAARGREARVSDPITDQYLRPEPMDILTNILSGDLKTHSEKRAVTLKQMHSQLRCIQESLCLLPHGKHRGWSPQADNRLITWLLAPRTVRRSCKRAVYLEDEMANVYSGKSAKTIPDDSHKACRG